MPLLVRTYDSFDQFLMKGARASITVPLFRTKCLPFTETISVSLVSDAILSMLWIDRDCIILPSFSFIIMIQRYYMKREQTSVWLQTTKGDIRMYVSVICSYKSI